DMTRQRPSTDSAADEVRALVAQQRFAADHVSARPGEIIAVDAQGRPLTPERIRRSKIAGIVVGVALGGGLAVAGAMIGGTAPFVLAIGIPAVLLLGLRKHVRAERVFQEINALVFAGRRDEAKAALARFPAGAAYEVHRLSLEGSIAF